MSILVGKVAIITGGTSGIGAAAAKLFVAQGATVVVSGRRVAEGEAVASALGPNCHFVAADVGLEEDIRHIVQTTEGRFGRIDCMLNNAGGPGNMVGIADTTVEEIDGIMATHVRGVLLGMKHVAPVMMRQRAGSIVNTASLSGTRTGFSAHTYSAAKAAVIHLTRCVATELGVHGIRVNSISPGPTLTGIFAKAAGHADQDADATFSRLDARFAELQPIPRAGRPDDIAEAALFLASDGSTFISGHDLIVDGANIGGVAWRQALERRAEAARIVMGDS
ncbi:MAG: glucose 1-dehydrogenase [Sphingomonas sp.]